MFTCGLTGLVLRHGCTCCRFYLTCLLILFFVFPGVMLWFWWLLFTCIIFDWLLVGVFMLVFCCFLLFGCYFNDEFSFGLCLLCCYFRGLFIVYLTYGFGFDIETMCLMLLRIDIFCVMLFMWLGLWVGVWGYLTLIFLFVVF